MARDEIITENIVQRGEGRVAGRAAEDSRLCLEEHHQGDSYICSFRLRLMTCSRCILSTDGDVQQEIQHCHLPVLKLFIKLSLCMHEDKQDKCR